MKMLFVVSKIFGTASYRISGEVNARKLIFNKYDKILLVFHGIFFSLMISNLIRVKLLHNLSFDDVLTNLRLVSFIVQLILNYSSGIFTKTAFVQVISELETVCNCFEMNSSIISRYTYFVFVTEIVLVVTMIALDFTFSTEGRFALIFYLFSLLVSITDVVKPLTLLFIIKQVFNNLTPNDHSTIEVHDRIYEICKKINHILKFSIGTYFMCFESIAEFIYFCVFDPYDLPYELILVSFTLWNTLNASNVVLIVYYCQFVEHQVNTTRHITEIFTKYFVSVEHRKYRKFRLQEPFV